MSTFQTKTLGDQGAEVAQCQRMLRRVGYSVYVTGEFCERFKRSVRAFQRDLKLPDTGVIDLTTHELIERCYKNMS